MKDVAAFANNIRCRSLELCNLKRTSHIGGALSVADILAVLYCSILYVNPDQPELQNRDRIYFSKGHACVALYAALELKGFFRDHDLSASFAEDGTYFTSHVSHNLPGIELSTGSLGHALGVACGCALALKRKGLTNSVFVILSDGELDEGSNWEAILFAAHHKLDNLTIVIDYNKMQSFGTVSAVMSLDPLADKFRAFNWDVTEVDGHSIDELQSQLSTYKVEQTGRPKCVIAHTTKGKGVSFMENNLLWHYRSPSDADLVTAYSELMANNA
jgi:transketolase